MTQIVLINQSILNPLWPDLIILRIKFQDPPLISTFFEEFSISLVKPITEKKKKNLDHKLKNNRKKTYFSEAR